jgi:hypothetical protein
MQRSRTKLAELSEPSPSAAAHVENIAASYFRKKTHQIALFERQQGILLLIVNACPRGKRFGGLQFALELG